MKTLEEVSKLDGITKKDNGINMHFDPIQNFYACIDGFDCPICENPISWKWDWEGKIPTITTCPPKKEPEVIGAKLYAFAHRIIYLKCNKCSLMISAENYD